MNNSCLQVRKIRLQKRTKKFIALLKKIVNSYDLPWTVRQVHYKLVSMGILSNTQIAYRKVSRDLSKGRYTGNISWEKIVDETRGAYKTRDYASVEEGIRFFLKKFRMSGRWKDADNRIEVWVEKRALRQLFEPITDKYDVYLAVGGGWNSTSAIWEAVKRITMYDAKRLDILYFGDLDPSGDDMPRDVQERLREFYGTVLGWEDERYTTFPREIYVHKIMVNEEHIEKYALQKRFDVPVKKGNEIVNKIKEDPRALSFYQKYGEIFQVEIEALPPNVLAQVLEDNLKKYVDEELFEHIQKKEDGEKERMLQLIAEHETQKIPLNKGDN